MKPTKLTLKLVRSFGCGFTIHSPTLNGVSVEIQLACFALSFWGRGQGAAFRNYWHG